MRYATFEHQKKHISLGIEDGINDDLVIVSLEIDGQDCSNALHFGNLYDYFEKLLYALKVEKDDDI